MHYGGFVDNSSGLYVEGKVKEHDILSMYTKASCLKKDVSKK